MVPVYPMLYFYCVQEFLESISAKLPVGQIANTPYAKLLSNLSKHTRTHSPKPLEPPDGFVCCHEAVICYTWSY